MNQELERINKLIDTAFEHIKPVDYDEVITELQKQNFALKKKCNTEEINEAYAATIERQDIERQKQAVRINKLSQKSEKQQSNITELQVRLEAAEKSKELLLLIKEDLLMRAEFDTEDGGAIVNLSGFIYDRLNETLKECGEANE